MGELAGWVLGESLQDLGDFVIAKLELRIGVVSKIDLQVGCWNRVKRGPGIRRVADRQAESQRNNAEPSHGNLIARRGRGRAAQRAPRGPYRPRRRAALPPKIAARSDSQTSSPRMLSNMCGMLPIWCG